MAKATASVEMTARYKLRLQVAEKKVKTQVINDFNHYAVQLASNLRKNAPRDTSAMATGIHPEFATLENPVVKIVSNAKYTTWVDEGTKPHFPPVSALIGWSRRHKWPGTVDRKASRRAFAEKQVAYKLSTKKGLKKHYAATKAVQMHVPRGAAAKGGGGERTVEAQAFLIARAISRRGGRKHNFIEPVMKPAKAEVIKICQKSLGALNL
jgi:hypothetical protein